MDLKVIEQGLKKPGKSKGGLAKALGRQPSAVTAILKGEREIRAREVPLIAKYLELTDGELLTPVMIEPIIGTSPFSAEPSALETIKSTMDRVAELERRIAALEHEMRAIGGLRPKKR